MTKFKITLRSAKKITRAEVEELKKFSTDSGLVKT